MTRPRRAVFLDRDGTLIELVPYLHDPADVRLVPGAAAALRRLGERGWARVVVTNQSGIARGYFRAEDVERVHARLLAALRAEGADLEAIEICPHHAEHGSPCDCRKPAPGMLSRAARDLDLEPRESWVIGDRWEDIAAGRALGCRGILVMTGYGREQLHAGPDPSLAADAALVEQTQTAEDLASAVDIVLRMSGNGSA
jgi:D-glycero-D-manno-heptose 1,7-bisphosphate phosphatase